MGKYLLLCLARGLNYTGAPLLVKFRLCLDHPTCVYREKGKKKVKPKDKKKIS